MGVEGQNEVRVVGIVCQYSGAKAAESAGLEGEEYPTSVRLIRCICAADVDEMVFLRLIFGGADGVFFAGCPLDSGYFRQCSTRIQRRVDLWKQILKLAGMHPERVTGFWVEPTAGKEFAEQVNRFCERVSRIRGGGEKR
ncbi:MAG: hydrogenase iron-sulfur subunit [bacterium JZ-2024 1]